MNISVTIAARSSRFSYFRRLNPRLLVPSVVRPIPSGCYQALPRAEASAIPLANHRAGSGEDSKDLRPVGCLHLVSIFPKAIHKAVVLLLEVRH
jgi:hypothetical protein